jgi:hypothetical protein
MNKNFTPKLSKHIRYALAAEMRKHNNNAYALYIGENGKYVWDYRSNRVWFVCYEFDIAKGKVVNSKRYIYDLGSMGNPEEAALVDIGYLPEYMRSYTNTIYSII